MILFLSTTISILWLIVVFFLKRKAIFLDNRKFCPQSMGKHTDLNFNTAVILKQFPLQLTVSEIMHITNNFSKANVIGDGGSGTVYRGILPNGQLVAIKKLGKARDKGSREFQAELDAIGRVKHKNLVPLLGYCSSGDEKLLIYEFMANGSLDFWLRGKPRALEVLDWTRRVKIAIGTAQGLAFCTTLFLQSFTGMSRPVTYFWMKISNLGLQILDLQGF